jgi:hypothetical protein
VDPPVNQDARPTTNAPRTLRPNRHRDYSYKYGYTAGQIHRDIGKSIHALVFTQMSARAGIKKHGKHAEEALLKEFRQFKDMDVFEPLYAHTLTPTQKADAIAAISVIKEKRDGTLKGRTVGDGRSQQGKYHRRETYSPTMGSDALMLTIIAEAHENRDVATGDVSGAYLHAFMKDFIVIRLTGKAVALTCDTNPDFRKFMTTKGNIAVLSVATKRSTDVL